MILEWLILLPVKLASIILACLLALPAAALTMRSNKLPSWLAWMLTTDNGLDALWQQEQHLSSSPGSRESSS